MPSLIRLQHFILFPLSDQLSIDSSEIIFLTKGADLINVKETRQNNIFSTLNLGNQLLKKA